MIVKQVSLDIEVNNSDIDLESVIVKLLEQNGYNILGSEQTDMSKQYNRHCSNPPTYIYKH